MVTEEDPPQKVYGVHLFKLWLIVKTWTSKEGVKRHNLYCRFSSSWRRTSLKKAKPFITSVQNSIIHSNIEVQVSTNPVSISVVHFVSFLNSIRTQIAHFCYRLFRWFQATLLWVQHRPSRHGLLFRWTELYKEKRKKKSVEIEFVVDSPRWLLPLLDIHLMWLPIARLRNLVVYLEMNFRVLIFLFMWRFYELSYPHLLLQSLRPRYSFIYLFYIFLCTMCSFQWYTLY